MDTGDFGECSCCFGSISVQRFSQVWHGSRSFGPPYIDTPCQRFVRYTAIEVMFPFNDILMATARVEVSPRNGCIVHKTLTLPEGEPIPYNFRVELAPPTWGVGWPQIITPTDWNISDAWVATLFGPWTFEQMMASAKAEWVKCSLTSLPAVEKGTLYRTYAWPDAPALGIPGTFPFYGSLTLDEWNALPESADPTALVHTDISVTGFVDEAARVSQNSFHGHWNESEAAGCDFRASISRGLAHRDYCVSRTATPEYQANQNGARLVSPGALSSEIPLPAPNLIYYPDAYDSGDLQEQLHSGDCKKENDRCLHASGPWIGYPC